MDGGYHIFNCNNRKWISLDKRLQDLILNHKDNMDPLKGKHPELYEVLRFEGFLSESSDEDIASAVKHVTDEYISTKCVKITVNPTLDCNLRCWYCYEKRHAGSVMPENIIRHTVSHISSLLRNHNVDLLNLSFFGGEPLLQYKKVVYPLVKEVEELCVKVGTTLNLHFTTNGLLITERMLNDLKRIQGGVSFQIAFDGSGATHNAVKSTTAGSDCYSMALNNVINAVNMGYYVTVRCNYCLNTLDSFLKLVDDLKPYHQKKNLRFMFQRIWQQTDDAELGKKKKKFFDLVASRYNISSNIGELSGNSLNRCCADYRHNIIVNHDGLVFRCTARDFNEANSIGRLTEKGLILNPIKSMEDFPYADRCRECRILPICPVCLQKRLEHKGPGCPFDIDKEAEIRNIRAAFHDLSGISVSI